VIKHRAFGLFGGYLILNPAGRPLEFHCTAAVKASRAQEILYGPTLQAYLQAELIGRALYEHARRTPAVVLTDRRAMLELGQITDASVAYLDPADRTTSAPSVAEKARPGSEGTSSAHHEGRRRDGLRDLGLDHVALAYPAAQADRFRPLREMLRATVGRLDLREPFARIRCAIREAHQVRSTPESRAA